MIQNENFQRYFNPRSHEGSDTSLFFKGIAKHISIHAPTKGATRKLSDRVSLLVISIHAPTKGATPVAERMCRQWLISIHAPTKGATRRKRRSILSRRFQSTLPRRERLSSLPAPLRTVYFNPRSHEGSDSIY